MLARSPSQSKPAVCALLFMAGLLHQCPAEAQLPAASDSLRVPLQPVVDEGTADADSVLTLPSSDGLQPAASDSAAISEEPIELAGPSWVENAAVGVGLLQWQQPESLEQALWMLPGSSLRVAGDLGMPAYFQVAPISSSAPEVWVDGVPSRNPADLDPTVWDNSVLPAGWMSTSTSDLTLAAGDPSLSIASDPPLPGRTVARTRFGRTYSETFFRGLSVTTPATSRILRYDLEEWKTEQGITVTRNPAVQGNPDLGRSKMRRFRFVGDAQTEAGRLRLWFGRGRRYYRGTTLSAEAIERWTGELAVGLDRPVGEALWRLRAYHLDLHVNDRVHGETTDGARLGLRLERRPVSHGLSVNGSVERWIARYDALVERADPAPAYVTRLGSLWQSDSQAPWALWLGGEGVHGTHLSRRLSWAAQAGTRYRFGAASGLTLGVRQQVRIPTLLETGGLSSVDLVFPTEDGFSYELGGSRLRRGAGALPAERQQRFWLGVDLDWWGLGLRAQIERWRLRDGIGWRPVGEVDGVFEGALALDVDQVVGELYRRWGRRDKGVQIRFWGHHVLGELEHRLDRGAGWPLYQLGAGLRLEHTFFSARNRLALDLFGRLLGDRFDDLHAPLGGTARGPVGWLDAALSLRVRDADLRLSVDNVFDREISQVLGTYRRGRQLRWSMTWPFYN